MMKSGAGRRSDPAAKGSFIVILLWTVLFLVTGCAPALYSVDITYLPASETRMAGPGGQKFVVTIAAFNDARPGGDDLLIGRVTTPMGGFTSVIPRTMKPGTAVSAIVKDLLVRSGHQVSVAMPPWDLSEKAIQRDWGRILIGGNIDQLEVTCRNDIPIKTYEAWVGLTLVFADVQSGKIFHRVSTASKNSMEHVYFSSNILEQQISSAATEAVEKALEGPALKDKLRNVLR